MIKYFDRTWCVFFLSVSSPHLSGIMPASLWNLPTLSDFKAHLRTLLFFLTGLSWNLGRTCFFNRLSAFLCISLYEWCMLTHRVFFIVRFAIYKSHPLLLLREKFSAWSLSIQWARFSVGSFLSALYSFVQLLPWLTLATVPACRQQWQCQLHFNAIYL